MESKSYEIYFKGPLFKDAELLGSRLLAAHIDDVSRGKYQFNLSDDYNNNEYSSHPGNIERLLASDLAIFCFDTTKLDLNTVVEFTFAKFLDIPAVLLRTDSRGTNDKEEHNWRLMCSNCNRTSKIQVNSEQWQLAVNKKTKAIQKIDAFLSEYTSVIAGKIVRSFDNVIQMPSLLKGDYKRAVELYNWALHFPGSNTNNVKNANFIDYCISNKYLKGLI